MLNETFSVIFKHCDLTEKEACWLGTCSFPMLKSNEPSDNECMNFYIDDAHLC